MFLTILMSIANVALASPTPQLYDSSNSITALTGTANASAGPILGNYYNYWTLRSNKTVYDLTRSDRMPVTSPKVIPMMASRRTAIIEPSRSALVIIDMQNFFLHPQLNPAATGGRKAVQPTLNMIDGFRANGMKVLWTNWGLDNFDLVTIPPSFLEDFSNDSTMATTFGSDMGTIEAANGSLIAVGRKLMRGSWNAQPWGKLYDAQVAGVASGTDLYFNKNRLSGLWGTQTPLGLYLQEHEITTLFFGGVNSDQCVWGTLLDAYYKGFDVVYVDDIAATVSPDAAAEMVR
ncbi:hypothetical protein LTR66_012448 [Elasticomyces elasticus]|nr:hypothetical protein LTR66_012448 [Elasticomyces elasticus]KAK5010354.1 hypothetical protein LTR28_010401 [Elasticomyces elasticus]